MANVNLFAVLVAAVSSMVVGSIWYGPLFGKMFMKAMGMDTWSAEKKAEMQKSMWLSYLGQFVASFVMFYVLAGLIIGFNHGTATGGMMTALTVWVGFVVPLAFGARIWGGKKEVFWLSIGNMLITLLIAGAIIGAWM